VAREMEKLDGVVRFEVLESLRELKKTSMRYFDERKA
jgi:hypothetical protein